MRFATIWRKLQENDRAHRTVSQVGKSVPEATLSKPAIPTPPAATPVARPKLPRAAAVTDAAPSATPKTPDALSSLVAAVETRRFPPTSIFAPTTPPPVQPEAEEILTPEPARPSLASTQELEALLDEVSDIAKPPASRPQPESQTRVLSKAAADIEAVEALIRGVEAGSAPMTAGAIIPAEHVKLPPTIIQDEPDIDEGAAENPAFPETPAMSPDTMTDAAAGDDDRRVMDVGHDTLFALVAGRDKDGNPIVEFPGRRVADAPRLEPEAEKLLNELAAPTEATPAERESLLEQALTADPAERSAAISSLLDHAVQRGQQRRASTPDTADTVLLPSPPAEKPEAETSSVAGRVLPQHVVDEILDALRQRHQERQLEIPAERSLVRAGGASVRQVDSVLDSFHETDIEDILEKVREGDMLKDEAPPELLELIENIERGGPGAMGRTILSEDAMVEDGEALPDWQSELQQAGLPATPPPMPAVTSLEEKLEALIEPEADAASADDVVEQLRRDMGAAPPPTKPDDRDSPPPPDAGTPAGDATDEIDALLRAVEGAKPEVPAADAPPAPKPMQSTDVDQLLAEADAKLAVGAEETGEPASAESSLTGEAAPPLEEDEPGLAQFVGATPMPAVEDEEPNDGLDIITRILGRSERQTSSDTERLQKEGVAAAKVIAPNAPAAVYEENFLDTQFNKFEFVDDEHIKAEKESLLSLESLHSILGGAAAEAPPVDLAEVSKAAVQDGEEEETILIEGPRHWTQIPYYVVRFLFGRTRKFLGGLKARFDNGVEAYFPRTPGRVLPAQPLVFFRDLLGASGIGMILMFFILLAYYAIA